MLQTTATSAGTRIWMNSMQAADYAGVDVVTVWRARKAGMLRAGGVGRAVRIHRDELDRWLAAGGDAPE